MEQASLLTLQYTLEDEDFDGAYQIYLDTERRSEKKYAVVALGVLMIVFFVLLALQKLNLNLGVILLVGLLLALSYVVIPGNKKFIKNYKELYGVSHQLSFFENQLVMEELQQEEADLLFDPEDAKRTNDAEDDPADFDDDEDEKNAARLKKPGVYETERMFLFYSGSISECFEPLPKRALSLEQLAEVQAYCAAHMGKKNHTTGTVPGKDTHEAD